jgi:NADH-quinone oxidoreductase subunit F
MPAYEEELEDAIEEGVVVNVSLGPKRIKGDGKKVRGVEFVRCESVYDREGRFRPVLGKEVVKEIEADTVVIAVGQRADMGYLGKEEGIRLTREGLIEVDVRTGETGERGVFAGGDMVMGSKNVCESVAAGKEAAETIDRYLQGRSLWRAPREEAYQPFMKIVRPSAFAKPSERILKENSERVVVADVPVHERRRDFREIVGVMSEEEAVREAKRCLKYDLELEEKSAERMAHMGKATFVLEP